MISSEKKDSLPLQLPCHLTCAGSFGHAFMTKETTTRALITTHWAAEMLAEDALSSSHQ